MPDITIPRASRSALVARLRAIREDERGEVAFEPLLITTALVALTAAVAALELPAVIRFLARF
jgi:hypothetical protein